MKLFLVLPIIGKFIQNMSANRLVTKRLILHLIIKTCFFFTRSKPSVGEYFLTGISTLGRKLRGQNDTADGRTRDGRFSRFEHFSSYVCLLCF